MRRAQPEQALQRQIADYLEIALTDAWFTTIPLGGGGRLRGAILRRSGTKPGIPDMLIVSHGRCIWFELKSNAGRPSEAQAECHDALRRAGCSAVYVVRSLDQAISALRIENVRLRPATVSSPMPETFAKVVAQ